LERILASAKFSRGRLGEFLRFVVEETLAGRGENLKESVIGVEVFQRGADFDPRIDPIVRVEARRLRQRLEEYYRDEGAGDAVRITLPKGGYVPVFESAAPVAAPARPSIRPIVAGVVLVLAVAVAGVYALIATRGDGGKVVSPTLFVAPFANLSETAGSDYFSEGLTEELIDVLAKAPGLRVITRGQAFQMKKVESREAAKALRAGWIVEGSVRRADARLRIAARLTQTESGETLWAHTYERERKDVFGLQQEIAQSIASALRVELRAGGGRAMSLRYTGNVEAYHLYLKGRFHWNRMNEADARLAIENLEKAIAVEPKYAPAHSLLAMIYAILGFYRNLPAEVAWAKAEESARRALEVDDSHAEAHAALGMVEVYTAWNWASAERRFQRALELNAASAPVRGTYALMVLIPQARLDEAVRELKLGVEADPLEPFVHYLLAYVHLVKGECPEAITGYRQMTQLLPGFPNAWWDMGMAHAECGQPGEAEKAFAKAGAIREAVNWRPGAAESAYLGRKQEALEILRRIENKGVRAVELARAYALAGEAGNALRWLEKAVEERDGETLYLRTDPRLRSLRGTARFAALVRRMGLSL